MMNTFLVLNVLFYAKEGLTQRDICDKTFQSKQTVNLIIKQLIDLSRTFTKNLTDLVNQETEDNEDGTVRSH